jgi:hypothetical protein
MKPLFFCSLLLLAVSCNNSNSSQTDNAAAGDSPIPLDTPTAAPADNTHAHEEGVNEERTNSPD